MATVDREKQIAEAEEMLGEGLNEIGFAKGLFFGQYLNQQLLPYPDTQFSDDTEELVDRLQRFCDERVDPVAIDRNERIPDDVISGLGSLGVLGACLPASCGGLDWSQSQYCRLLEVLGGHCASTALFVNAHHSIGPRALVLFGDEQQQQRWLPEMASGQCISAFALTEPEAGSDAGNVQSMAIPTDDGGAYIINGEKRWITNGGIAGALTVMARTPVTGSDDTKITAFMVTPDLPGFEVVEERMEKCGVRGTATSRMAFHDMRVPRENVLGREGKGLRVALTVLDFGRTTFGASCTGAAKTCVRLAREHAARRVQFQQSLNSFELVKEKLAYMEAGTYAMEACTYQTAALIDSEEGDFMLETAMLKVFATEILWKIINDTFQIHGGLAYFNDQPFERMMRDARINMIGEGANDVLRAFMALVGMRDVGLELEAVLNAIFHPISGVSRIGKFAGRKLTSLLTRPSVDVSSPELEADASELGRMVALFGSHVEKQLRVYQREIVERQYQLGRVADVSMELYASACVLNRLDALLRYSHADEQQKRWELQVGRYFLLSSRRRMKQAFKAMWDNDDEATTALADAMYR